MEEERLRYTPDGRDGYECVLTTSGDRTLTIRGDVNDPDDTVRGDAELAENLTLVMHLKAYGRHESQYRRLRAREKRASHEAEAQRHRRKVLALAGMIEHPGNVMRSAFCSSCLSETVHREVEDGVRALFTYLCDGCGGPTTPCRVPGCTHMASRGFRRLSTPRFCAEHRHDIPSFAKLDDRLLALEEYEEWLTFDKRNASRATKIGAGVVASTAVIAPVAFVAVAPAIGGMTGALTGLSGAAATSHGLAMWGFGSLAAGGLGMAGGTAVITAVGGALGGALGASVTAAYVGADKSFKIERLREGAGPPVVFSSGFLTEREDGWGAWQRLIDTRYPGAPVYRVVWGASELRALRFFLGRSVGIHAFRRSARKVARVASRKAAGRLGPLGPILLASGIAKNPWSVAKTRAGMTGAVLADLIARTDEDKFVLIGHSLGGRVMLTVAEALATMDGGPRLESIHLLGAAVSRGADWRPLSESVSEQVWNYYSKNDKVLERAYRMAEVGKSAVGRVGFGSSFDGISDRNVSRTVAAHSEYLRYVDLVGPPRRAET